MFNHDTFGISCGAGCINDISQVIRMNDMLQVGTGILLQLGVIEKNHLTVPAGRPWR
ncbi:hypothetical protein D3C73_765840 [compost metagenome]